MIRTLQWITVRRARRLVDDSQHRWHSGLADLRPFLLELSVNILTGPTTLTDADLMATGVRPVGLLEVLGADDRVRTGDLNLGKVALYQLSHVRVGFKISARRTIRPDWVLA